MFAVMNELGKSLVKGLSLVRNIPALRKSFFYYLLAISVVCGLINFSLIKTLRRAYLLSLYQSITGTPDRNIKVLLYDYVAHLDPKSVEGWLGLARSSLEVRDLSGAIYAYQKAIRLQPDQQEYSQELANIYRQLRQDKKADAVLNSHPQGLP